MSHKKTWEVSTSKTIHSSIVIRPFIHSNNIAPKVCNWTQFDVHLIYLPPPLSISPSLHLSYGTDTVKEAWCTARIRSRTFPFHSSVHSADKSDLETSVFLQYFFRTANEHGTSREEDVPILLFMAEEDSSYQKTPIIDDYTTLSTDIGYNVYPDWPIIGMLTFL